MFRNFLLETKKNFPKLNCSNRNINNLVQKRLYFNAFYLQSLIKNQHKNNLFVNPKYNYYQHPIREGEHEPTYPIVGKEPIQCPPREAVQVVRSNNRVYIHGAAATPNVMLGALCEHCKEHNLRNIELIHIHTHGDAPQVSDEYKDHFRDNSFFIGANVRTAVNKGYADFTPIFLSEIPQLLEDPDYVIDAAFVTVSPPDKHGFCSLGTSVDCTRSAISVAKTVIAVVNKYMPRTHGDSYVHISHFDYLCQHDEPLHESPFGELDEVSKKIGDIIAKELIPDRACLQMGIGGIPDAVLLQLKNHRDLGIHTEMFSDGILPLVDAGVITNAYKNHYTGKIVTSFMVGSRRLYDFVDDNPLVRVCDCSFVNDTHVIRSNPKAHAINSCIEVDITGQVCADSIGTKMYSGIGGQMDFMRGAHLSPGGKAIMAMSSRTSKGESKILPVLKPGAGVVTTRAHLHYLVTEYGYAKLFGKTLRERARLIINLAHPDDREWLEKEAVKRFGKLQN